MSNWKPEISETSFFLLYVAGHRDRGLAMLALEVFSAGRTIMTTYLDAGVRFDHTLNELNDACTFRSLLSSSRTFETVIER